MPTFEQRVPYSAIVDRPPLTLPGSARMVVWTIVNVELWSSERAMPRAVLPPPMGAPLLPDLPNWAWHEYGMRVGFWRLHESLPRYGVVPTLAINGAVVGAYPRVAEAAAAGGWEFMGPGFVQGPMHKLDDQRAAIVQTMDAIRGFTGRAPRGWESPGLTETAETVDILAEEGIEYVADWALDDQPCDIETASGPLVSIPYTLETNDITMMALQHHGAAEMLSRGIDQFERLYQESESITRVMAVSLHPYISGVPHRIGYVERLFEHIAGKPGVLLWRGEQILDWYREQRAGPGAG
jgi:peptidoglycan/xylan/chitin deacetylase (PgdA/CDA1 family)